MATRLLIKPESQGRSAEGFCTPKEDKAPQKMRVMPKRVVPVIFIPGIMGSNLRMTESRQKQLKRKNNVAWNPDRGNEMVSLMHSSPATRQLQLDKSTTQVDTYEPKVNPTGDPHESSDERHSAVTPSKVLTKSSGCARVLHLPGSSATGLSLSEKARHRGWGEIFFGSYRTVLEKCEICLNDFTAEGHWSSVLGVDPAKWGAIPRFRMAALTKAERDLALKQCMFPVYAVGYNWLQSNLQSAIKVRERIESIIREYTSQGYDCRKVILVTHSMGGLLARALIHPSIGNFADSVLGVVHGVMPALGAPAAYKRIKCGVEGIGPAAAVLGRTAGEVAAVLGNSPGGLELLPNKQYGNDWLRIVQDGRVLKSLPAQGDPYREIYDVEDRWYGLLSSPWLNPAKDKLSGVAHTRGLLVVAKHFHELISEKYHPNSYAHYGVDTERPSWETITWELDSKNSGVPVEAWRVTEDSGQGNIGFLTGERRHGMPISPSATLRNSEGPGDETVPARSAEAQSRNAAFRGVFQQRGYEHQLSYADENALSSTIYSVVRIAQLMKWD